ncbi:helix-turn-helix domain-containing protein [Arthrobacter woluwensis]|uniref:helix-turn-helix domain-containing protein n=1 Tax=Arthrobacter woluwensis TaxID=156980 RepID=UPI0036F49F6C
MPPERTRDELLSLVDDLKRSGQREDLRPEQRRRQPTVLSPAQTKELLYAYQVGTSSKKLAAHYHLDTRRVLALLREHRVPIRRQPPNAHQVQRAVELYKQGQSVSRIASELGCAPTTLNNHLRKAGVVLRPRGSNGSAKR